MTSGRCVGRVSAQHSTTHSTLGSVQWKAVSNERTADGGNILGPLFKILRVRSLLIDKASLAGTKKWWMQQKWPLAEEEDVDHADMYTDRFLRRRLSSSLFPQSRPLPSPMLFRSVLSKCPLLSCASQPSGGSRCAVNLDESLVLTRNPQLARRHTFRWKHDQLLALRFTRTTRITLSTTRLKVIRSYRVAPAFCTFSSNTIVGSLQVFASGSCDRPCAAARTMVELLILILHL